MYKDLIKDSKYDFLRTNEKLNDNIALLTLGGSIAYGTNNANSDIDIRGIRLNSREEILTMNCDDKPYENKELDVVVYPLKQIVKLLTNCNPNTIEILGTKEEHILYMNEVGKMIRDNKKLFLSKIAYHSFGGYAISQLRRLQNALARDTYNIDQKEEHILGAMKRAMVAFNDKYEKTNLNIYLDKSTNPDLTMELNMDINLTKYPVRDMFGILSEMSNIIKDYNQIKHRNNKKTKESMYKHAMHLIRLYLMGLDVLEREEINTYRTYDKDFLTDIREEKYTFEYIFELVDYYEKRFEYAYKHTSLPDKPDHKKINELVSEINLKQILIMKGN